MTLNRMPLFVWAMLVQAFMILFAMPWVATATQLLAMDRLVATHFFNPAEGGDALLWQHLFWFFGHPEVYIIFMPALGFVSMIVATFTRRPVFGYPAMVLSMVTIGFLSFGLWVHHMFATGVPQLGQSFFTAASMMITIPSGIQIFCWIATIWAGGRASGAVSVCAWLCGAVRDRRGYRRDGGVGVVRSAGARHLLRGGPLPLCADRRRGVSAPRRVLLLVPQDHRAHAEREAGPLELLALLHRRESHLLPDAPAGLEGMPRRVYTYLAGTGWGTLNLLASIGAVTVALGVLLFLINVVRELAPGRARR